MTYDLYLLEDGSIVTEEDLIKLQSYKHTKSTFKRIIYTDEGSETSEYECNIKRTFRIYISTMLVKDNRNEFNQSAFQGHPNYHYYIVITEVGYSFMDDIIIHREYGVARSTSDIYSATNDGDSYHLLRVKLEDLIKVIKQ